MESLRQNKALLYAIVGSGGTVLALALGLIPELAAQFEIIDFPPDVSLVNASPTKELFRFFVSSFGSFSSKCCLRISSFHTSSIVCVSGCAAKGEW